MKPSYKLTNWKILPGNILTGILDRDHEASGCEAGTRIYTSTIINRDGNTFETRNSFYTVEGD